MIEIGSILLAILIVVGLIIYNGVIFMLTWNWLIPPIFGLATLTVAQAFGILLLVRFLTFQRQDSEGLKGREAVEAVAWVFGRPLLFLAIAWVVSFYV